jgi:predicted transcriptional regulator of viral defense system
VGQEADTRSNRAWDLAGRQHGIVTRQQLLALGFGRRSIEHRIARGRLFRVSLGVYAVGWPALNQKRQWMAAVLAGGEGAALGHRSAAALWEMGEEGDWIDISVRRRCELRSPGIRFRGRPSLAIEDIVFREDFPVTSPAQTLVDLATELGPVALERAVNDADKRDLIDPEALRDDLSRFGGETWHPSPASPSRQALLPALGLGPGDLFPPHRQGGESPHAAHQTACEQIRGRLLLA